MARFRIRAKDTRDYKREYSRIAKMLNRVGVFDHRYSVCNWVIYARKLDKHGKKRDKIINHVGW